jgi:hypothetical protein
MARFTGLQDQPNSLSGLAPRGDSVHEHVKVSFFGTIGFGRAGEVRDLPPVASLARQLTGSLPS